MTSLILHKQDVVNQQIKEQKQNKLFFRLILTYQLRLVIASFYSYTEILKPNKHKSPQV